MNSVSSVSNSYQLYLSKRAGAGQLRSPLPPLSAGFCNFTGNDYLGLSSDKRLLAAGFEAARRYGSGAGASRILLRDIPLYTEFEEEIAESKKTSRAILFSSGYQANASVIPALLDRHVLGEEPRVFSDKLIHASMHSGCFASGVTQHRFPHLDLDYLELLLGKYAHCRRPKFILAETVFGMDGDVLNVGDLVALNRKYGAFIFLDEAHATGVFGADGYGLSGEYADDIGVSMGTFSKALGSAGAYVACSDILHSYIWNRCSGFVYSTAPSPFTAGTARAAWRLLPALSSSRSGLLELSSFLRKELALLGFNILNSKSHIIPVVFGEERPTQHAAHVLFEHGILVSVIRPPTVPPGSSRLRIALSARHSMDEVTRLLSVLGTL